MSILDGFDYIVLNEQIRLDTIGPSRLDHTCPVVFAMEKSGAFQYDGSVLMFATLQTDSPGLIFSLRSIVAIIYF